MHAPEISAEPPPFGTALACLVLALAIGVSPLFTQQLPPFDDYVNHLARCYVIASQGRDALLAQFYQIDWKLIPNLAMDVIVPPLIPPFGVYAAGKLFLALMMGLLIVGPQLVHHALFGRWSFAPLVAALFLYNGLANAGTVNYLFGLGLALVGIAAWIALRDRPALLRAAVSAVFVAALYVSHFAACALYGVTLFCLELWQMRADRTAWRANWPARVAALVAPFLLVPVFILLGPPSAHLPATIRWEAYAKARGIFAIVESQEYSRLPDAAAGLAMAGAGAWLWWRGLIRVHPAGWIIAFTGLIVFLATPVEIMSAWGADVRLPLGFLFILVGFLDLTFATRRARGAFILAFFGLLLARTGYVEYAWTRLARSTDEMARSFELIRPGSRILVAKPDDPAEGSMSWLTYLPCWAMIERSSLCSLAFSDPRQQVLTVKAPFRAFAGGYNDDPPTLGDLTTPPDSSPSASSGRVYWTDWADHYDYLYLVHASSHLNPIPDRLELLYSGNRFQLYAIRSIR